MAWLNCYLKIILTNVCSGGILDINRTFVQNKRSEKTDVHIKGHMTGYTARAVRENSTALQKLYYGETEEIVMSSMMMKKRYATLPVSKWDKRIRDNKRRRNAEIRKHIFQLILAAVFICIAILCANSMISKAGDARGDNISVKYYKNICVERGETLTSIAKTYADEEHYETLDQYIEEVLYMNHLDNADDICAGYYLIIPYYASELL